MRQFSLQCLVIVLITFTLSWTADKIMDLWLLKVAFPETIALEDFHWEDFAFKLRTDTSHERRIVLVNIGQADRRGIAKALEIINEDHPKVVGVLIFFNCYPDQLDSANCPAVRDPAASQQLGEAMRRMQKVVLTSALRSSRASLLNDSNAADSVEYSDDTFTRYAVSGYGSLPQSKFQTIKESRFFNPRYKVNGKEMNSFSVQVSQLFDSVKTARFLQRDNEDEIINFKGNVGRYQYDLGSVVINKEKYFETVEFDSLIVKKFEKDLFKDKIVLVGFLGDNLNDPSFEDKFYTPLNPTFAGRSYPDMLGLVIHANIISMILNEDFINQLSNIWENVLLIIIVVLNASLFIVLLKRNSLWYDSLCFIIPVTQIVLISWLRIELMTDFGLRLDLQNVIYLVAFVSFATNLYFGPLLALRNRIFRRS